MVRSSVKSNGKNRKKPVGGKSLVNRILGFLFFPFMGMTINDVIQ
jgi:hypothetical protein